MIIKSSGTSCTSKKTYEATSDQDLPAVFTDGTRASGPNDNVVLTLHEVDIDHHSVEIRLNFIKTTLVIRQVSYLKGSFGYLMETAQFLVLSWLS